MPRCIFTRRLKCIRVETMGVEADSVEHAAALAVRCRSKRFDTVEVIEADDIAVTGRCCSCPTMVFDDEPSMRDIDGKLYCAPCWLRCHDVVTDESE